MAQTPPPNTDPPRSYVNTPSDLRLRNELVFLASLRYVTHCLMLGENVVVGTNNVQLSLFPLVKFGRKNLKQSSQSNQTPG